MKVLIIAQATDFKASLVKYFSNVSIKIEEKKRLEDTKFYTYNVVIVDKESLDIGYRIRKDNEIPILAYSEDKVSKTTLAEAFNRGIDSFASPPLCMEEIFKRFERLVKKDSYMLFKKASVSFGEVEINLETKEVTLSGKNIPLTITEYTILQYFTLHRNKSIINRNELTKCLSAKSKNPIHRLNVHMYNIKKKLGGNFFIKTMPGRGFVLRAKDLGK